MNVEKWIEDNEAEDGIVYSDDIRELLKTHAIVPREAIDVLVNAPELNPSNYSHEQACELNAAVCYALAMIAASEASDE